MRFQEPSTKKYASYIISEINHDIIDDFLEYNFSLNLIKTMELVEKHNGWKLKIPAKRYDQEKYKNEHIIVYTGKGSYANAVDNEGGWVIDHYTGHHIGYVSKSINYGINRFKNIIENEGKEIRVFNNFAAAFTQGSHATHMYLQNKEEKQLRKEAKKYFKPKKKRINVSNRQKSSNRNTRQKRRSGITRTRKRR